jgi:cytochrome c oxidase subunit 2
MRQSALHPAADSGAALIGQLGTVLYVGAALIFVFVMTLAIVGVVIKGRDVAVKRWVIGGGMIFPSVTVTALLMYSLAVGNGLSSIGTANALQLFLDCFGGRETPAASASDRPLTIHVVGKQWWWEVRYELPNGNDRIMLANEIRMPVDRPVELVLSTTDVIHSFWVPSLAGKVDMIPGRTTRLRMQTSEVGQFRGICAEYCGGQHALMAIVAVTQTQSDFASWLERQAQPATPPTDATMRAGYEAFFAARCQTCHTIRGTPANGNDGPDLTHVGGRVTLAAGILDNHIGTMAGWIAGAQDIKPGNKMPSDRVLTGEQLRALSAWLGSLE